MNLCSNYISYEAIFLDYFKSLKSKTDYKSVHGYLLSENTYTIISNVIKLNSINIISPLRILGVGGNALTILLDNNRILKLLNISFDKDIINCIANKPMFGNVELLYNDSGICIYTQDFQAHAPKEDTLNKFIDSVFLFGLKNKIYFGELHNYPGYEVRQTHHFGVDKFENLFLFDFHDMFIFDNMAFELLGSKLLKATLGGEPETYFQGYQTNYFIPNNDNFYCDKILFTDTYQKFYFLRDRTIKLIDSTYNKYTIVDNLIKSNNLDKQNLSIIDLGCAQGMLSLKLAQKYTNATIFGVESSSPVIEFGNKVKKSCKLDNFRFIDKKINIAEHPNKLICKRFNVVLCYSLVHHLLCSFNIDEIFNYILNLILPQQYLILELPLKGDSCLKNWTNGTKNIKNYNVLENINTVKIHLKKYFIILNYGTLDYLSSDLNRYYFILKKL